MKINEIYVALEFTNFSDYPHNLGSLAPEKKEAFRQELLKNPRILLDCGVPASQMLTIVQALAFDKEEKFRFVCDLVKFKVLKNRAADFAAISQIDISLEDREKQEAFVKLQKETAAQTEAEIEDEKNIAKIVCDLRKKFDNEALQLADTWGEAISQLKDIRRLRYLPNIVEAVFAPKSNMTELEIYTARSLGAKLVFNLINKRFLEKENLSHRDIVDRMLASNPQIGTENFRIDKGNETFAEGTIMDFFYEGDTLPVQGKAHSNLNTPASSQAGSAAHSQAGSTLPSPTQSSPPSNLPSGASSPSHTSIGQRPPLSRNSSWNAKMSQLDSLPEESFIQTQPTAAASANAVTTAPHQEENKKPGLRHPKGVYLGGASANTKAANIHE